MGLNIGRLLYGIRTKYEMNVKDICRGICSPSSYCMYENGQRTIPAEKAYKIASFLNTDIEEIFLPFSFTLGEI